MCVSPMVAEGAAEPDVNIRCESSHLEALSLMNNELDGKQTQLPPGSHVHQDKQQCCSSYEEDGMTFIKCPPRP